MSCQYCLFLFEKKHYFPPRVFHSFAILLVHATRERETSLKQWLILFSYKLAYYTLFSIAADLFAHLG